MVAVPDVRRRLASEVPALLRYARTIAADGQLAEDLVQETMLRALQRADSYTVDAATVVERAETREELEDALVRLPVIYRTAVVLHDSEGMTVAQIADVQGVGLPAAKQRLRRGRMMLVDALSQGRERRAALRGVPLRCWDARRKVSDYLDDELLASDRVLVQRHLETCPTCPPLYAGLVGARAALGALRDRDSVVPVSLADRIKELLASG